MVCWLSAYPGGFPLRCYACLHRYYVISAVWPYTSRIIDPTGKVLTTTSRWGRLTSTTIDLDKRLFHTDNQAQHILPVQAHFGDRVSVETFNEEHLFTVESNDESLSVDEVKEYFGLVEYTDYIARCTKVQKQKRG